MNTTSIILVIYYISILLVANFNKNHHWIISCLFGIILCIIQNYGDFHFLKGFEKIEFLVSAGSIITVIIYGIYFILQKNMCVEK